MVDLLTCGLRVIDLRELTMCIRELYPRPYHGDGEKRNKSFHFGALLPCYWLFYFLQRGKSRETCFLDASRRITFIKFFSNTCALMVPFRNLKTSYRPIVVNQNSTGNRSQPFLKQIRKRSKPFPMVVWALYTHQPSDSKTWWSPEKVTVKVFRCTKQHSCFAVRLDD